MMLRTVAAVVILIVADTGCSGQREEAATPPAGIADTTGARVFVQAFFDWYVAGRRHPDVFRSDTLLARDLRVLLEEDYALQGRDTVGPRTTLDGDVFTSQDPCPPYRVQGVQQVGNRFRVNVKAACSALANSPYPEGRTLEIAHNGTHWEILNVHYPHGKSIMDYLCEYALADRRPEKRPARCVPP